MEISFFGDFLLHRGLIDVKQLSNAVDYQLKQNKSVGQIALDERLVTQEQIRKIKKIQRIEDKKFGQIAVENRILFPQQLEVILEKQKKINIVFGDALLGLGLLDCDTIDKEALEFEYLQRIKETHIYTELAFCDKNHILDNSVDMFRSLFYRSFQEHIKFQKVDLDIENKKNSVFLLQRLFGDIDIDYILVFENEFNGLSPLAKMSKKELIDLFCDLMQDLIKRVAIDLAHRNTIVRNSDCEVVYKNEVDLSDFDQLRFITTAGDIKLFIKV